MLVSFWICFLKETAMRKKAKVTRRKRMNKMCFGGYPAPSQLQYSRLKNCFSKVCAKTVSPYLINYYFVSYPYLRYFTNINNPIE